MDVSEKVKAYFDKGVSVSKNAIDKGVEVSKKALNKAGAAVQDFSDKSVVRIEKHQFETKREEQLKALGKLVADKIITGGQSSFSAEDSDISVVITEIKHLDEEIAKREAILSTAE
ncbi:MAG TPA: hypothetical protein DCL73_16215, partial [Treponema sp.]|nr:hypothetical protein [Treponema sp.]